MRIRKNLVLPVLALALMMFGTTGAEAQDRTIVTTAQEAGSFNTLLAALKAADLDGTLATEGPFTVFAPTDEAFAKLPEGTLEELLGDTEALTAILTYHVVAGMKGASEVVGSEWLETLNGQALKVASTNDAVEIGGAKVIQTDIDAGNGVIHVIDSVMLPPSE